MRQLPKIKKEKTIKEKIASTIKGIDYWLANIIFVLMLIGVVMLMGISVASIIFRWLEKTYLWMDPLTRHLVFLLAFLGGAMATGNKNHIAIDIIPHYLKTHQHQKLKHFLELFIHLSASALVFWLAWVSIEVAKLEFEYGSPVFLGIHSGYMLSIIPVGLFIISLRMFLLGIKEVIDIKVEKGTN